MNKLKKIAFLLAWISLFIVLLWGLKYGCTKQANTPLFNIQINLDSTRTFVTKKNILEHLDNKGLTQGKTLENIDLNAIENTLQQNPFTEHVQVHKTMGGKLHISLSQRVPIARVFTSNDKGYYIDENGLPMPISTQYTERVLLLSGDTEGLIIHNASLITLTDVKKNKTHNDLYLKIFSLLKRLYADPLWNAQITQIVLNKDKTLTMTTLAGNQTILFGAIDQVEKKLKKLLVLYKEGFSNTGWEQYSTIDLRFENQIVCKKRNI